MLLVTFTVQNIYIPSIKTFYKVHLFIIKWSENNKPKSYKSNLKKYNLKKLIGKNDAQ